MSPRFIAGDVQDPGSIQDNRGNANTESGLSFEGFFYWLRVGNVPLNGRIPTIPCGGNGFISEKVSKYTSESKGALKRRYSRLGRIRSFELPGDRKRCSAAVKPFIGRNVADRLSVVPIDDKTGRLFGGNHHIIGS